MAAVTPSSFTIGRLARAAGVGIETIRYYQDRMLLPVPSRSGGFRHYPTTLVGRIRFIKRAQDLGFTLEEIAGLLRLNDGADRESIRAITAARLTQIESKIADLTRMQRTLRHLLHECKQSHQSTPCPIIETLVGDSLALSITGTADENSGRSMREARQVAAKVKDTTEKKLPTRSA